MGYLESQLTPEAETSSAAAFKPPVALVPGSVLAINPSTGAALAIPKARNKKRYVPMNSDSVCVERHVSAGSIYAALLGRNRCATRSSSTHSDEEILGSKQLRGSLKTSLTFYVFTTVQYLWRTLFNQTSLCVRTRATGLLLLLSLPPCAVLIVCFIWVMRLRHIVYRGRRRHHACVARWWCNFATLACVTRLASERHHACVLTLGEVEWTVELLSIVLRE